MNIFVRLNLCHYINIDKRNNLVPRMTGEHEALTVQTVDGFLSLLMEQEKKTFKNINCINLKKRKSSKEKKICIVLIVTSLFLTKSSNFRAWNSHRINGILTESMLTVLSKEGKTLVAWKAYSIKV